MYCQNCGQQVPEDSFFCKHCGKKVDLSSESVNAHSSLAQSDFITLNCPSCGGKLKVQPNAETLVCHYCGAEHLIRRDMTGVSLERFARCPTCGRNDKSVKATIKFGYPPEPKYILLQRDRFSCGIFFFLFVILCIVTVLGTFADEVLGASESIWSYLTVIIIFGGLVLFFIKIIQRNNNNKEIKNRNSKIISDYEGYRTEYQRNLSAWEMLFYCERDGTFFNVTDHRSITKDDINSLFPYWSIIDDVADFKE